MSLKKHVFTAIFRFLCISRVNGNSVDDTHLSSLLCHHFLAVCFHNNFSFFLGASLKVNYDRERRFSEGGSVREHEPGSSDITDRCRSVELKPQSSTWNRLMCSVWVFLSLNDASRQSSWVFMTDRINSPLVSSLASRSMLFFPCCVRLNLPFFFL